MTSRSLRRVLWPLSVGLVVIALIAVSSVLLVRAHDRGDLNELLCAGDCGPELVSAPGGVPTIEPVVSAPALVTAGAADPAAVEAAIAGAIGVPELGPRVAVSVREAASGTEVLAMSTDPHVPASTTKLLTGYAALRSIDPQQRFATRVVADGSALVLVGGGDPYLVTAPPEQPRYATRASLTTLADRTAEALRVTGTAEVTLGYDAGLFTGPLGSVRWEPSYLAQDIVTPISALWVDRGVHDGLRDDDPAAAAAQRFAALLRERGITVSGEPAPATAGTGTEVAVVRGATLAQVVEQMELSSDNEATEVVLRHVALARDEAPSFDGGVAALTAVLDEAGIDTAGLELHDGSGLSRANRISPSTLTDLLVHAATDPVTSRLLADLPVGGFTGSLGQRFGEAAAGRGVVRAKTGTLTGVHSLAGLVTTFDGVTLTFAVMTDATEAIGAVETQAAIDRIADALAACTCGG